MQTRGCIHVRALQSGDDGAVVDDDQWDQRSNVCCLYWNWTVRDIGDRARISNIDRCQV